MRTLHTPTAGWRYQSSTGRVTTNSIKVRSIRVSFLMLLLELSQAQITSKASLKKPYESVHPLAQVFILHVCRARLAHVAHPLYTSFHNTVMNWMLSIMSLPLQLVRWTQATAGKNRPTPTGRKCSRLRESFKHHDEPCTWAKLLTGLYLVLNALLHSF